MKEITANKAYEPPVIKEIRVIDPTRTSLVPVRMDPRPIRKRRDLAAIGIEITAGVSIALNVIFAVIIYVLQAGPI